MIERPVYLKRLANRIGNGSIKIVTGIRRTGKSYLLNKIFYEYLLEHGVEKSHIIKFAFDSAEDLDRIGEDLISIEKEKRNVSYKKFMSFVSSMVQDDEKYFLLLDEIQRLDSFEFVLNAYLSKNMEIYVTGSNSKFLSSDVITEFRGRGDQVHVMPLSFSEFYNYVGGDKSEALEKYMVYGGLPQVVLAKTDEEKSNYLQLQMERTYLRDVIERHNVKNQEELGKLLDIISSGISTLVNPTKLANTFKSEKKISISDVTVKQFIEYFKESYILDSAMRFDVKGKKYIGTPYKIYFEDLGLRNARLNFRQIEYTHLMENVLFNELKYRGYKIDVGVVEVREKNIRKQLEVDFVVNKGSQRLYIQSAYDIPDTEKMKQETKSFDKIKDSFKKIIVVEKSTVKRQTENGYLLIGLKDFLLEEIDFH